MKFKQIIKRITGLSTPIFGVSWNPESTERDIARRIITFLEDRRILYAPGEMEVPSHCITSVIQIREFLTVEIGKLQQKDELSESLRAMRAACRKFLNTIQLNGEDEIRKFGTQHGHRANWAFNGAIGELRGVFGIHIARIAVSFGIDIEKELATILPEEDAN